MIIEQSYQAHKKNWASLAGEHEERLFYKNKKDSISYYITTRSLKLLAPFFNEKRKWLTVGDYNGLEANFLIDNKQDVTASDLDDTFLAKAHDLGLIDKYDIVNSENIPFEDSSFDYVLCKEAYHHFPRAYLSLYEMVRCSKKATIIIEPIDILLTSPVFCMIKSILDLINPDLINKVWKNRFSFESVGNYVFKISEREIEKLSMGIGLEAIAFKGVNFVLNHGIEKELLLASPPDKKILNKLKSMFKRKDMLSRLHLIPYNHKIAVLFKSKPELGVINEMKRAGYSYLELPKNPYL